MSDVLGVEVVEYSLCSCSGYGVAVDVQTSRGTRVAYVHDTHATQVYLFIGRTEVPARRRGVQRALRSIQKRHPEGLGNTQIVEIIRNVGF